MRLIGPARRPRSDPHDGNAGRWRGSTPSGPPPPGTAGCRQPMARSVSSPATPRPVPPQARVRFARPRPRLRVHEGLRDHPDTITGDRKTARDLEYERRALHRRRTSAGASGPRSDAKRRAAQRFPRSGPRWDTQVRRLRWSCAWARWSRRGGDVHVPWRTVGPAHVPEDPVDHRRRFRFAQAPQLNTRCCRGRRDPLHHVMCPLQRIQNDLGLTRAKVSAEAHRDRLA